MSYLNSRAKWSKFLSSMYSAQYRTGPFQDSIIGWTLSGRVKSSLLPSQAGVCTIAIMHRGMSVPFGIYFVNVMTLPTANLHQRARAVDHE